LQKPRGQTSPQSQYREIARNRETPITGSRGHGPTGWYFSSSTFCLNVLQGTETLVLARLRYAVWSVWYQLRQVVRHSLPLDDLSHLLSDNWHRIAKMKS
jgi:hypothetical protein